MTPERTQQITTIAKQVIQHMDGVPVRIDAHIAAGINLGELFAAYGKVDADNAERGAFHLCPECRPRFCRRVYDEIGALLARSWSELPETVREIAIKAGHKAPADAAPADAGLGAWFERAIKQ